MQIEHAFVINLDRRHDRLERFNREIVPLLPFPVERFTGCDGKQTLPPVAWHPRSSGAWGCMVSHRSVIEKAVQEEWEHLLTFEDDVLPLYPSLIKEVIQFAVEELPDNWDICYLGLGYHNSGVNPPERVSNHLLRLKDASYTQSYLLSRSGILKVLAIFNIWEKWSKEWQIDHALSSFITMGKLRAYACYPTLFGQTPGISDNTTTWSDWKENEACEPRRIIDRRLANF